MKMTDIMLAHTLLLASNFLSFQQQVGLFLLPIWWWPIGRLHDSRICWWQEDRQVCLSNMGCSTLIGMASFIYVFPPQLRSSCWLCVYILMSLFQGRVEPLATNKIWILNTVLVQHVQEIHLNIIIIKINFYEYGTIYPILWLSHYIHHPKFSSILVSSDFLAVV